MIMTTINSNHFILTNIKTIRIQVKLQWLKVIDKNGWIVTYYIISVSVHHTSVHETVSGRMSALPLV